MDASAGVLSISGAKHVIPLGIAITIGNLDKNSINITDASVSQNHAIIKCVSNKDAFVYDIDSSFGTRLGTVNLPRYIPFYIENGAILTFGNVSAMFEYEGVVSSQNNKKRTNKQGVSSSCVLRIGPVRFNLPQSSSTTIGGSASNSIVIDSESQKIATIEWVSVIDVVIFSHDRINRVQLNGKTLALCLRYPLRDGDTLLIGDVSASVEFTSKCHTTARDDLTIHPLKMPMSACVPFQNYCSQCGSCKVPTLPPRQYHVTSTSAAQDTDDVAIVDFSPFNDISNVDSSTLESRTATLEDTDKITAETGQKTTNVQEEIHMDDSVTPTEQLSRNENIVKPTKQTCVAEKTDEEEITTEEEMKSPSSPLFFPSSQPQDDIYFMETQLNPRSQKQTPSSPSVSLEKCLELDNTQEYTFQLETQCPSTVAPPRLTPANGQLFKDNNLSAIPPSSECDASNSVEGALSPSSPNCHEKVSDNAEDDIFLVPTQCQPSVTPPRMMKPGNGQLFKKALINNFQPNNSCKSIPTPLSSFKDAIARPSPSVSLKEVSENTENDIFQMPTQCQPTVELPQLFKKPCFYPNSSCKSSEAPSNSVEVAISENSSDDQSDRNPNALNSDDASTTSCRADDEVGAENCQSAVEENGPDLLDTSDAQSDKTDDNVEEEQVEFLFSESQSKKSGSEKDNDVVPDFSAKGMSDFNWSEWSAGESQSLVDDIAYPLSLQMPATQDFHSHLSKNLAATSVKPADMYNELRVKVGEGFTGKRKFLTEADSNSPKRKRELTDNKVDESDEEDDDIIEDDDVNVEPSVIASTGRLLNGSTTAGVTTRRSAIMASNGSMKVCIQTSLQGSLKRKIENLGGTVTGPAEAEVFISKNIKNLRQNISLVTCVNRGIPVVTTDWVEACVKMKKWVDPWEHAIEVSLLESKLGIIRH